MVAAGPQALRESERASGTLRLPVDGPADQLERCRLQWQRLGEGAPAADPSDGRKAGTGWRIADGISAMETSPTTGPWYQGQRHLA
jgi:hypothetical protein